MNLPNCSACQKRNDGLTLGFCRSKVINGIQNGPYKNIYNPENFFVGSQGSGAANNWAAGYAAGDTVQEEVFDMIDREADGSDSLEASQYWPPWKHMD